MSFILGSATGAVLNGCAAGIFFNLFAGMLTRDNPCAFATPMLTVLGKVLLMTASPASTAGPSVLIFSAVNPNFDAIDAALEVIPFV